MAVNIDYSLTLGSYEPTSDKHCKELLTLTHDSDQVSKLVKHQFIHSA